MCVGNALSRSLVIASTQVVNGQLEAEPVKSKVMLYVVVMSYVVNIPQLRGESHTAKQYSAIGFMVCIPHRYVLPVAQTWCLTGKGESLGLQSVQLCVWAQHPGRYITFLPTP